MQVNRVAVTALIFFLFISVEALSQKFLALEKRGRVNRLRFYAGEKINVRLSGENFYRSGFIDAFTDTSFFLDGENILVKKIEAVLVHKTRGGQALLRQLVFYLPAGGAFFLGITAANSAINDSAPLVPESMYYTAGSMAAAGLLLYPLTFRVYKTKNHPLRIIDVTITSP
jgi:hypothetical protein